jgi:hypothetical protein
MLLSAPVFQPTKETLLRDGQFKLKIEAGCAACDCGIPRRNLRVSRSKGLSQRAFQRRRVSVSVSCRELRIIASAPGRGEGFALAMFWKIDVS